MKLWDKGALTSEHVHAFTVGNDREMDVRLAAYDVQASAAHVAMLCKVDLLTVAEKEELLEGLDRIEMLVRAADFAIPVSFEDIHSYLEWQLTEWYGETGKKVHTARSRNDQVLVALQLYLKTELASLQQKTQQLGATLCDLAEQHADQFIPGYTHTQVAMPSSIGMWLAGYAECLADDAVSLQTATFMADQNPLGTAAGYGSTFPIDRQETTRLLGFSQMKINPVAAQLNRGKLELQAAFSCAQVAQTLGKLANDCVLFLCQNFGYISFPGELTTGSSIMPHKKNPDVFELVRAKAGVLAAIPMEISLLTRNLTGGYHRDFQLLKEPVFKAIEGCHALLDTMQFILPQMEVVPVDLSDERFKGLFSVDQVAQKVQQGVSFREAYKEVGKQVLQEVGTIPMPTTHTGSLFCLDVELIRKKLLVGFPAAFR